MIELLSPAGKMENLKFAIMYGADAIYFGGQDFSLRANAQNFSLEEIKDATEFAHKYNKKVFVTVNIVFHNEDLDGLKYYLKKLDEIGIDAIIASDITVIKYVKELNCKFDVHLSTQASCLNSYAVKFWQSLGVKRVVLAREASRKDIIEIKNDTGIEIESFIHGAMCCSFSGKCILSNYVTNRDANRGGCAQICRWEFMIDKDKFLSITPKDLNMVTFIDDMIDIGVNSFKIEGRMRSIYYVATVILVYRRIIDKIIKGNLTMKDKEYYLSILNRCANRESTPQFYDKLPGPSEQYFNGREEASNQDFLGLVLEYDDDNHVAKIEQRNYFKVGDDVQFFGPDINTTNYVVREIYDENNNIIDIARHPQMIVYLHVDIPLKYGDMMRLKVYDYNDF